MSLRRDFRWQVIPLAAFLFLAGAFVQVGFQLLIPAYVMRTSILDTVAGSFYGAAVATIVAELVMTWERRRAREESTRVETSISRLSPERQIAFELALYLHVALATQYTYGSPAPEFKDVCEDHAATLNVSDSVVEELSRKGKATFPINVLKQIRDRNGDAVASSFRLGWMFSILRNTPLSRMEGVFGSNNFTSMMREDLEAMCADEYFRQWVVANMSSAETSSAKKLKFYTLLIELFGEMQRRPSSFHEITKRLPSVNDSQFEVRVEKIRSGLSMRIGE